MKTLKQPKPGLSIADELKQTKELLQEWFKLFKDYVPARSWPDHGNNCGCMTCEMRKIYARQQANPIVAGKKSRLLKTEKSK
jgi:hypothetical protein